MKTRRNALAALLVIGGIGSIAGFGPGAPAGAAAGVDPADFTNPQPNPYFPLEPGTVTILRGSEDGERLLNKTRITSSTKVILGVTTTVVSDVLYADGMLAGEDHGLVRPRQLRQRLVFRRANRRLQQEGNGREQGRLVAGRCQGGRGRDRSCPRTLAPPTRTVRSSSRATQRTRPGSSHDTRSPASRSESRRGRSLVRVDPPRARRGVVEALRARAGHHPREGCCGRGRAARTRQGRTSLTERPAEGDFSGGRLAI